MGAWGVRGVTKGCQGCLLSNLPADPAIEGLPTQARVPTQLVCTSKKTISLGRGGGGGGARGHDRGR